MSDTLSEDIRRMVERIAELEAERLTLNAMVFAPGEWYCPQCHFSLSRQTLFVQSGTVGISDKDRDESEPCPNDGTTMERVTYKQRMEEHYRWGVDQMKRNQAAQEKFDQLHEIVSNTTLHYETWVLLVRRIREGLTALGNPPPETDASPI